MADVNKEPVAVKLPFETGEYLCTWNVPDGQGGEREIPGMLTVEPGRYPHGVLYGNMPIEWQAQGQGQRAASFPQRHEFDVLTGRLSSGAYVALMNGELSYWFESQGRAIGALAVLSLDEFDPSAHRAYSAIELQIEGLEAVAGVSPILRTTLPAPAAEEHTYSVTVDRDASWDWNADGRRMTFRYDGSTRFADAYEFRMVFGPVLRIDSAQPLTIADWWMGWVRPLRQMMSVLTSGPREIRYFLASDGERSPRAHRDQVFGWDITHTPVNSTRAAIEEIRSAVNLKEDELSLLDLLIRWQELESAHHPLIETYGSIATADGQHPRSVFLLLLQALEGLYGYEHESQRADDLRKHKEKRDSFVERASECLAAADIRFLKKFLMKRPAQGLDQALIGLLSALPYDVRPELEATHLVAQIRGESREMRTIRVESVIVKARNALSHGASSFEPSTLDQMNRILDRVVRAETIRILGGPASAQVRALRGDAR